MLTLKALEMNGAGNRFLLIDARTRPVEITSQQLARWAALHDFDQLLVLEPSAKADARYRIWNRDGEEVGACGNGARAAAWFLMEDVGLRTVQLDTAYGLTPAERLDASTINVDLGQAQTGWKDIPLSREMDTTALDYRLGPLSAPGAASMGNPHIVFFVETLEALPITQLGPTAENDPLFPERVNVGFAEVKDRTHIRLRVWERGAGLTRACGTGAAAAIVAGHRKGLLERHCRVDVDGGQLGIVWREDNHVWLSGPVELEGEVELEL